MQRRAYLIAKPRFDEDFFHFLREFVDEVDVYWDYSPLATEAEKIVEVAGRVCYKSFGSRQHTKDTASYIKKLIQNKHDSVLEHAAWTFALCGVSRAFTHQLVRHRIGFSYSQLSQQYHDESHSRFVPPIGIERFPDAVAAWKKATEATKEGYRAILEIMNRASDEGRSTREDIRAVRSAARSVLPNATETAVVVTANARSLRHLFRERGAIVGDLEMRLVTADLLDLVRPEAPALFWDFAIETLSDGVPIIVQKESE